MCFTRSQLYGDYPDFACHEHYSVVAHVPASCDGRKGQRSECCTLDQQSSIKCFRAKHAGLSAATVQLRAIT